MCNSAYKIADCPSIHADAKITRWFTNFCIKYFVITLMFLLSKYI